MKFKNTIDEIQYNILNLNEIELRKRLALVSKAKDHKKSRDMKNSWRRNKHKIMKGISKWSSSTAGKRFHRALGRFNSLRESSYYVDGMTPGENEPITRPMTLDQVNDALLGISSIETHLFLELQYYESDPEAMSQFLEIVDNFVMDSSYLKVELLNAYRTGEIDEEDFILLVDITQFFQDPKSYVYAKRELLGLTNDTDSKEFLNQVKFAEDYDKTIDSDVMYSDIDELFTKIK